MAEQDERRNERCREDPTITHEPQGQVDQQMQEQTLAVGWPNSRDQTTGGEQMLAVGRPDNQDQTTGEEQMLAVRRPDNQDQTTGEEQMLAVRRSDNQDQTTGEEQMLAVRRSDNQDQTTGEEQMLAVRRSDNQDQTTGEEQMLAVRRPDNQDQTTGEEQMLAVRRSDNQDQTTGEEQMLAVRRSDNQDQTTGEEQMLAVRRSDNQDHTKGEEQMLAVRKSDHQDQTTGEEQMLAVRRPDNQDQTTGEEQMLAVRRSDNQDQTTGEEQMLAVRRSDNQDHTKGEEQMLAVRRPDNQDQTTGEEQTLAVRSDNRDQMTGEEQMLAVRRSDNQDQTTGAEQMLAVRRPDNQDQTTDTVPFAPFPELSQTAVVQQISGAGNLAISNAPGSVFNIYQYSPSVKDVHTSHQSGHTSVAMLKDQPSTSEEPTIQVTASPIPDCVHSSHQSGHPSDGILENQPSTSQEPTAQGTAARTSSKPTRCYKKRQFGKRGTAAKKTESSSPKKGKRDSQAQAAADSCEDALKSHYKSTGSYVQLLPWVDDDKKHIMDIYTKLELAEDDKSTYRLKEKDFESGSVTGYTLESYEDIFLVKTREGDLIHIAVLNGLPGRGKSTLFDKMAYDWSDDSSQVVQKKYKLVILLKMHALEQTSDLIDAIFDQLLAEDTWIEKSALETYIKNNPGKVLILLDGFDEFMTTSLCPSSFGSILKILNRKVCRDCHVLVSTRPSHFDRLVTDQLVKRPFTHVKVLGFNENTIREYVNKFFLESDDDDNSEGLLKTIDTSAVLSKLAESPMLLLLMCLLWREDSTLQETMTCLYGDAIRYIFKRKANMSEEEIADVVIKIGKIGLHGLLYPDQVLSFKECDFGESVLEMALKAGILTRQRVLRRLDTHNSVQFIHKTFQEFSASKYMQSLCETDVHEFQKTLDDIMSKGPKGFEYLLRFCCGDNEACTDMILKAFQKNCQENLSESLDELAVHCYCEGQSKCLPANELICSVLNDFIVIPDGDFLNSITYFMKQVVDQTKDSGNAYLAEVKTLNVTDCDLRKCGKDLAYSMNAMTNLKCLILNACLLSDEVMKHIVESLWDLPNMVELSISCSSYQGSSASLCSSHIKQLQHLQKLDMSYFSLTGQDVTHITKSLGDLLNLVELDLSSNDDLGGTGAVWSMHLRQLQHLEKLGLSNCSLIPEDIMHIAKPLPNLVELDLSDNDELGSTAVWSLHLKQLQQLQMLNVSKCQLTGENIEHFAKSLGDLPNLVELDLSGNTELGGTAALWSMHLKQLQHLERLNFSDCSLIQEDIIHVAKSLSDLPNLVELDLCGNDDLGSPASVWSIHLKHLAHLEKLTLCAYTLTEEDRECISESLSDLSKDGLIIEYF